MSAAEPAHPEPPGLHHGEDAAVIPLTKHRATRGTHTTPATGRWNRMTDHQPPPTAEGDGPERTPHEQIADDVEKTFNAIKKTLTDDDTALVFQLSIDTFVHVLRGYHARKGITDGQLADMLELFDALRAAPDLI